MTRRFEIFWNGLVKVWDEHGCYTLFSTPDTARLFLADGYVQVFDEAK